MIKEMTSTDQLRRMVDELEIRNLINDVARVTDAGDINEYGPLWAADAVAIFPRGSRSGRDEIVDAVKESRTKGLSGLGSATRHLLTNLRVMSIDGDVAEAVSCVVFLGDTTGTPAIRSSTRYLDTLVRESTKWQISQRRVVIE